MAAGQSLNIEQVRTANEVINHRRASAGNIAELEQIGAALAIDVVITPSGEDRVVTCSGMNGIVAAARADEAVSITAAVVGVIANLALFFAWHVFWPAGRLDAASFAIAAVAAVALVRFKVDVIPVIAAAGAAGWALWALGLQGAR